MERRYEDHNRRYDRFFRYFYESIYRDKYYIMGDYDTMTIAFLMDTALYYLVAVHPVYNESAARLGMPPFYGDGAELGLWPMRFYARRLVAIAKRKKALGIYGNHNAGRRPRFVGFTLRTGAHVMLWHGLLRWAKAELANALTYVVRPTPLEGPRPDLPPRAVATPDGGAEAAAHG